MLFLGDSPSSQRQDLGIANTEHCSISADCTASTVAWCWTLHHQDSMDTKQPTVCVCDSKKPNPLCHISLQLSFVYLPAGNYVDILSMLKYFPRSTLTMRVLVLTVGVERRCFLKMMTEHSWRHDISELDQEEYGTRLSRSPPAPSFLSLWRTSRWQR